MRASCRTRARTSRLKNAETCGTVHELTAGPPPSPPARVPDPRRGRAAAAAAGLHGWPVVKAGPSVLAEEAAVRERVPTGFDPDPGLHDLRCTSIRSGLKVRAQLGHGTRFCLYLRRTRGGGLAMAEWGMAWQGGAHAMVPAMFGTQRGSDNHKRCYACTRSRPAAGSGPYCSYAASLASSSERCLPAIA